MLTVRLAYWKEGMLKGGGRAKRRFFSRRNHAIGRRNVSYLFYVVMKPRMNKKKKREIFRTPMLRELDERKG